jgi:hypothetical protein
MRKKKGKRTETVVANPGPYLYPELASSFRWRQERKANRQSRFGGEMWIESPPPRVNYVGDDAAGLRRAGPGAPLLRDRTRHRRRFNLNAPRRFILGKVQL